MKKGRVSLRRIALIFIISAAPTLFTYLVALRSQEAWQYALVISSALKDARSVILVEFERDFFGPELVFSRVPASPRQVSELRAATGAWLAPIPPWRTMCFNPHHRVEIVRSDGAMLRFDICFHCQNFTLGNNNAVTMPAAWRKNLVKFFTAAGMPPRDNYSDLIKKHPDYHLIEEARAHFDQQVAKAFAAPPK